MSNDQIILQEIKDIKEELKSQKEELKKHGRMLEKHGEILEKHTEILEKHTETLEKHSKQLEEQSELLKRHEEHLKAHDEQFESIKASLIVIEKAVTEKIPALFDGYRANYENQEKLKKRVNNLEEISEKHSIQISALEKTAMSK